MNWSYHWCTKDNCQWYYQKENARVYIRLWTNQQMIQQTSVSDLNFLKVKTLNLYFNRIWNYYIVEIATAKFLPEQTTFYFTIYSE